MVAKKKLFFVLLTNKCKRNRRMVRLEKHDFANLNEIMGLGDNHETMLKQLDERCWGTL